MTRPTSELLRAVRARVNLAEVIRSHGLKLRREGDHLKGCCPFHGDRSPSFAVYRDHFHCYGCGARGDCFDFVQHVRHVELAEALELLALDACIDLADSRDRRTAPPASQQREPAKLYPPEAELRAVWDACESVDTSIGSITHLSGKRRPGIAAWRVAPEDLARLLPDVGELPPYVAWWRAAGLRVVVPVYDAQGDLRGLRARHPTAKLERPASMRDASWRCSAVVFASRVARRLFAGDVAAAELAIQHGVEIVEGLPAFLARATHHAGGCGPVVGVFAGAWTQAHADRIPDGARVSIDVGLDAGGDRYRRTIEATLAERWRAGRLTVLHSARLALHLRRSA